MISRKLAGFGVTIFTEMTRLAIEHQAINLAQGFPDFDGPEFVKEAAIAAIRAGHNQYARMSGIPALNQAIAARYQRDYGLSFDPDTEITVTSGCTEAIFDAIAGICDVGDEVILFEPYYDSYRAAVCMAGAIPKVITLHRPDWSFDLVELERAFSERTRAILVNSPHNPTGKVYSRAELEQIAALCQKHNVLCITDEVYEHLIFEGQHVPMASLPGMRERTITLSSLGKTFSLTGWKIGWACTPAPLTRAVRSAHQFVTFATATPFQHAAVAALSAPESYYQDFVAQFREKRDFLASVLEQVGFTVMRPQGTYFICAGIEKIGKGLKDIEFSRMLTQAGVAVIPPSVFYERSLEGEGYVRFAFCKRRETLEQAAEKLVAWRNGCG